MTWSHSRQTTPGSSRIVAVMETAQPAVSPAAPAGSSSLGVTAAPFIRSGTAAVIDLARRADRLGYGSLWVAEVTGAGAINVTGDQALVRDTISAYRRAGVDVPIVFPLTWGSASQDALESTLRAAIAPPAPAANEA